MPKKYVKGYYVTKSGAPCVLDCKLDTHGALVPSADGRATVFLRHDEITLWGIKTRITRAIARSKRIGHKISTAEHVKWPKQTQALFRPGQYEVIPCRNPAVEDIIGALDAQERAEVIESGIITLPMEHVLKPQKPKRGQMLLNPHQSDDVIADL